MRCPNQATTLDNGADDPSLCICLREFFDSRPRGVATRMLSLTVPCCIDQCTCGVFDLQLSVPRTFLEIEVRLNE